MKKRWIVLAAGIALLVLWLMSAEWTNKTFYSKVVVIDGQRIELPMKVSDFVELTEADLLINETAVLKPKDYVTVSAGGFDVGIYNDSKESKGFMECQVLGISQNMSQVKSGAKSILFPDGFEIGLQIEKESFVLHPQALGSSIKGDVSIGEDDSTMTVYIGKRWVDLGADWENTSERVIYPVHIVVENNIITQIEMVFVDTD